MLKYTLIAAAAVPAYATSMMPMSKCDDSSMMMKGKVDGMTNMAHKMKSCSMHMDKAMNDMGTSM